MRAMTKRRPPDELTSILLFNLVFFGTLAWLGSANTVADADGWWYELGQIGLAIGGMVLFWVAWWFDERGHERQALLVVAPAVAVLSIWLTSVHAVLV
jgi:hypothetical protein